jgi:CO/xanthine dehydrogenase FAD-binding subunit
LTPFAVISARRPERGEELMPVTVRTFANSREAAAALSSDRGARYLGGGTLVMRALNEGDISISTIVRAQDQALMRIEASGPRVIIGAGVTFARILAERDLAFLHAPARSIGGPAVRNMGTVGGNLFAPNPYGDFTVALLALDAVASVQGGFGARDVPIEEFLQSRERQAGTLVLSVSCQKPLAAEAFRYRKIARIKPKGGSVITLAAHLPVSSGRVLGARIALGSMAPTQIRAKAAERALEGRPLDASAIVAAASAAVEGTSPADNALASGWYRREIVGVHLRRLLSGQE